MNRWPDNLSYIYIYIRFGPNNNRDGLDLNRWPPNYGTQVVGSRSTDSGRREGPKARAFALSEREGGENSGNEEMGGGEHHGIPSGDFRTKVWSLTGGPNCRPKHWKRNTAIAMAGIILACIPIAMKSAELEQRPHHPVRPIPSQLWCKNFGNKEY